MPVCNFQICEYKSQRKKVEEALNVAMTSAYVKVMKFFFSHSKRAAHDLESFFVLLAWGEGGCSFS